MLRFGGAKAQHVVLLTWVANYMYVCAGKKTNKKVVPRLDSNPVPSAYEARALPVMKAKIKNPLYQFERSLMYMYM